MIFCALHEGCSVMRHLVEAVGVLGQVHFCVVHLDASSPPPPFFL